MYETILVEKRDNIATLTFNRPEQLNAASVKLMKELCQALRELKADKEVRVVIMTGAGRAFSAGFDLGPGSSLSEALEMFCSFEEEDTILNFDKPLIAAVNGYALGQGLHHALFCDVILASEKAKFGFLGPRVGGLCHAAVWVLPLIVGRNKANELLLACEMFDAEEAFRIGLVSKVVPHEQLMHAALEMAGKIVKNAPLSIKFTKRALMKGLFNTELKAFLAESMRVLFNSADMKEAMKAFQEKREPVFKGNG
ncbi:MAG: enoyl-CoA hydratase/isomerase family protein [Dissulfuribacterales bacterium]